MTLGYICEELDTKDIGDPLKNKIIGALIENIYAAPDTLEATKLAIKAFPNAISLLIGTFRTQKSGILSWTKCFWHVNQQTKR